MVTVIHGDRLAEFSRSRFRIPAPHWIAEPPRRPQLGVKLRHGERLDPCTVSADEDGGLDVELSGTDDPGIAAGQFAVLYDGDECLGGGAME